MTIIIGTGNPRLITVNSPLITVNQLTEKILLVMYYSFWNILMCTDKLFDSLSNHRHSLKKGMSLQTEIITGNKQAVIIYGLLPINAIDSSDCIFQNLFNPSNRKMWVMLCFLETAKHRPVTKHTKNKLVHINWPTGDEWRVQESDQS